MLPEWSAPYRYVIIMIISVINIYEGIKKKNPLGPRVQGMQIFPRWPCLRYILLLFWRHSSTAITPSVLPAFSSFFLQGIWILIHHPPPLPPCMSFVVFEVWIPIWEYLHISSKTPLSLSFAEFASAHVYKKKTHRWCKWDSAEDQGRFLIKARLSPA